MDQPRANPDLPLNVALFAPWTWSPAATALIAVPLLVFAYLMSVGPVTCVAFKYRYIYSRDIVATIYSPLVDACAADVDVRNTTDWYTSRWHKAAWNGVKRQHRPVHRGIAWTILAAAAITACVVIHTADRRRSSRN